MQVFLCFTLANYLIVTLYGLPVSNTTVEDYDVSTASNEKETLTKEYPTMSSSNCIFIDDSENLQAKMDLQMEADINLLVLNINFAGLSGDIPGLDKENIYKPSQWLRPHGRLGKQLLLLRHNFQTLPLSTLSWNVHEIDISLIHSNPNCTKIIDDSAFETAVREYLLDKLIKSETGDTICNIHITDNKGDAEFLLKCCQWVQNNTTQCEYLTRDKWLNMLFTIIELLKWCVFLVGPVFVPGTLYGVQHIARRYTHFLGNRPLNLKVLLTKTPESYPYVKVSRVNYMPRFKEIAQSLTEDVVHNLKVTQINMKIRQEDLIPENYAPVGLLRSFYDSFVRCKIRKRPLLSCCNSGICLCSVACYKCLRIVMRIFVMCFLGAPLFIKAYLYYTYKQEDMIARKNAALRKGLRFYDENHFITLLFLFVYLLLMYCIIGCLNKSAQQRCLFVFQTCFRNMKERNIVGLLERSASLLLKIRPPSGVKDLCQQIIVWIFKLVLVTIILPCYIIPTINLSMNLFGHLVVSFLSQSTRTKINQLLNCIKKKLGMNDISGTDTSETDGQELLETKQYRCNQFMSIFLCILSLEFGLYLMVQISSVVVDVAVYTLLAIMLSANTALTYVSLILLLGMYANSCFSYVVNRYMSFNKTLITMLLEHSRKDIEEITSLHGDQNRNIAISVKTNNLRAQDNSLSLAKTERGLLRWRTSNLVFFLGENYTSFVSKNFFFDACKMPYYAFPGELCFNYLRAFGKLIIIVAFLLIVLVTVLSFGETYQLSPSNQLLATLAGGLIPWILTKAMTRTQVSPSLDQSNINFKLCVCELLYKYKQDWLIDDIIVKDIEVAHDDFGDINQIDIMIDYADLDFTNIQETFLTRQKLI